MHLEIAKNVIDPLITEQLKSTRNVEGNKRSENTSCLRR